ncbi:MAG: response regulator transcription factor [Clostridia bacterium]|nr:response regulator transcription factor [Clostridia bacterium]
MPFKILVAEDDADIVELLRLYLENEGYRVLSASNGVEALELAERERFDLAVLDIMMPRMNGLELARRLREKSTLPILILSAKNQDSDKILGLNLGADDYMTKPFNPLEILAQLMRAPGRIFTKVQLYENINGAYFESDDNTMMVHISKLREKIEDDPRNPRYIKTVRGLGYKIEKD